MSVHYIICNIKHNIPRWTVQNILFGMLYIRLYDGNNACVIVDVVFF